MLLRAGLGGLAASLAAIEHLGRASHVPGAWSVEPGRVVLDWGEPGQAGTFFEALFAESFRIDDDGCIDLPGTWWAGDPLALDVRSALQDALRQTFLQHGKHASKRGGSMTMQYDEGQGPVPVEVQPYDCFVAQEEWTSIAAELDKPLDRARSIKLAGWATPGAVQRHVAFAGTKMEYSVAQALCACFALVGCQSYLAPRGGGILVVPDPADLTAFARLRPRLTPRDRRDIHLSGVGDALLRMEAELRVRATEARLARALQGGLGFLFRSTPWAKQQKSRVHTVDTTRARPSDAAVDLYDRLARSLSSRLVVKQPDGKDAGHSFTVPSGLRGFVSDNIASRRPWHSGFGDARSPVEPDRFLHTFWEKDNHGALRRDEKEGLLIMTEQLEQAERALVDAVHQALKRRFGVIYEENKGNPVARRKRMGDEVERWRLALLGAKTEDQARYVLADLWSRGGPNAVLRERWTEVLPLLREDHWRTARDLALIALVSYRGRETDDLASGEPAADDSNPS